MWKKIQRWSFNNKYLKENNKKHFNSGSMFVKAVLNGTILLTRKWYSYTLNLYANTNKHALQRTHTNQQITQTHTDKQANKTHKPTNVRIRIHTNQHTHTHQDHKHNNTEYLGTDPLKAHSTTLPVFTMCRKFQRPIFHIHTRHRVSKFAIPSSRQLNQGFEAVSARRELRRQVAFMN